MAGYLHLTVSASDFSHSDIGTLICDALWTADNAEALASEIVSECASEERESELKALCEAILKELEDE